MKLVIMTQPMFFVEEDKILTLLFEEGMERLHLHKPDASPIYSGRLLSLMSDDVYKRIVVHDNYYLKAEYGLGGIHIEDPMAGMPDRYKGKFSRECYDINHIAPLKKKAEYVLLDRVFNDDNPDRQSLIEQAAAKGIIDKHVYAKGGINIDTIRRAKELGFGGVVVCHDLWSKFNIHSQLDFKELVGHFDRLRNVANA